MTPDERQLITDLFSRMRGVGLSEKDREAEALISQSVRQFPDAPYMLVQSVLVQEQALQQAEQRIQDLEERLDALERQERPQQSSGSFLGGLFGGSRPSPPSGQGSVPPVGRQSPGYGSPARAGMEGRPSQPQYGGMPGPMPGQPPAGPGGGGFMRQAMSTAAGVAGGVLLANTISNMFGGGHAQARTPDTGGDAGRASPLAGPEQSAQAQDEPRYQDESDNDPGTYDADYSGDSGGGDAGGMDV